MKLREANKEDNRRFHELSGPERIGFLEDAYSQVFAKGEGDLGEFTPPFRTVPETLSASSARAFEMDASTTASKLNFLMTRMNLEGRPEFEERVRELALLRFEYLFLTGDMKLTQDPELVAGFFEKRGRPDLIRPALRAMGEEAVRYEHLAEKILFHPTFEAHLGTEARIYTFRFRLHYFLADQHYTKEQAAGALMDEGFDLEACDFNRWHTSEIDWKVRRGEVEYEPSAKESRWLAEFIAGRKGADGGDPKSLSSGDETALVSVDKDDEDPEVSCGCSKQYLEELDAAVRYTLEKQGDKPGLYWVRALAALTSDHAKLCLDGATEIEAKMWDNLWGGNFKELAYQLKGANPQGRTRNGLRYNLWALTHSEHKKHIDPVLAEDTYAMSIAGDILVGDLPQARETFDSEDLKEYKNPDKIRAAISLAWEMMQHPGESDDIEGYRPPRGYLFNVAGAFRDFLNEAPSARPYFNLFEASSEACLGRNEKAILRSITNLGAIERIYTQLGGENANRNIKRRFLKIFHDIFDADTEFMSLRSEVRGITVLLQDETFRKYVDDRAVKAALRAAVSRTKARKDEYDAEEPARGRDKFLLTLFRNSVLRPYLPSVDEEIRAIVNGMIDDVTMGNAGLLTSPLSLRHGGDLTIVQSEVIEAYMLADRCRDSVEPEKMQKLVSTLLALNSDMTVGNRLDLTSLIIDRVAEQADPAYERPSYFPDAGAGEIAQRMQFLSNVYSREKDLEGLDVQSASTAVTNVLFRGNYAEPYRFYPHIDAMLAILSSPVAGLLPKEGLGFDALKEYVVLSDFMKE